MHRQHGTGTRGLDAVPQAPSYEGRFGRMFRSLATFKQPDELLERLANGMREDAGISPDNPEIPAGYTYLGQFIDHDITFDPTSSLQRMNDPEGLVNFRTPRFDLDSLYGSGPADEPFQYDETSGGTKLLVGKGRHTDTGAETGEDDLPRNDQGRALIGDPRNDENVIVSQLHLVFLKLHNRFVDEVAANQSLAGEDLFKEAQRLTRWHYQWVVVHDFLERTVGKDVVDSILLPPDQSGVRKVKLRHYKWKVQPFMPVEFSVAAYRFGHSQVRPTYSINDTVQNLPIFSPNPSAGPLEDFRGFRFLPQGWTVDWSFFFDTSGPRTSRQASRAIDTRLAEGLFSLPGAPAGMDSLALLNLRRGRALGLPSGQRVATAVGVPDLTREELGFWEPAPLWFYVLKESELRYGGTRIGPVGGRIVAEVLLGLLAGDPLSWINAEPAWTPSIPDADGDGRITMVDVLRFAVPNQAGPPVQPPPGGWS